MPGAGRSEKYARPEAERRWLVATLPDLSSAVDARLLEDRYLAGTRLRLRRATPLDGGPSLHKLGQKVRPDPADPGLVLHTTMYLTTAEYERLRVLPGAEIRKVRHVLISGGRRFALDVFDGRHQGLALMEAESNDRDSARLLTPPPCTDAEVTGDERFSGGFLAFAPAEALSALMSLPHRPAER